MTNTTNDAHIRWVKNLGAALFKEITIEFGSDTTTYRWCGKCGDPVELQRSIAEDNIFCRKCDPYHNSILGYNNLIGIPEQNKIKDKRVNLMLN